MIVVDTNIIACLYISGEKSLQAEQLLTLDSRWCAPVLWRSEFRSVLTQYLRKDILGLNDILIIIQQAEKLLDNNEYKISSSRIMELVNSSNCSAYDCEFVALAQHLDIPLITVDKKILREFPKVAMLLEVCLA